MKRLHYPVPNNLSLLHDEILSAIPALSPVNSASGEREAAMQVEGDNANVWLTVPDNPDEVAIGTVIAAHDSNATQPDRSADRKAQIANLLAVPRSNWTTAQLREIVELSAKETTG